MNNTILLVNPWIADFAAYDLWAKPLGLLYVGKFLREYGYNIDLIDLQDRTKWSADPALGKYVNSGRGKYNKTKIEKPAIVKHIPRHFGLYGATQEQFEKELDGYNPAAILITSQMTYWYPGIQHTVNVLRKRFPEVPIILGGIYATLFPEHAQNNIQPDYLITGAGEKQVLKLLDHLFNINRDFTGMPQFNDQGCLPWDLYDKLDAVGIMTSRGCPHSCSFCATKILHPEFCMRQPDDVINEIVYIYNNFNVRNYAFYDDALFTNKEIHIKPILRAIIDQGLGIKFHTPNGLFAREIDQELARLMKNSGFKTIRLSLESSVKKWQKESSSKVNSRDFSKAVAKLKQAGYKASEIEAYLIMGLPGQTPEEVKTSLRFVYQCGAISRLASFTPIPGTKDWKRAISEGFIEKDIDPLLTNNTVYACANPEFPQDKFQELRHFSNQLNQKVRNKYG